MVKGPVASYNSRGRDEAGDEPFSGDTGNKCITKGQVSSNCAFFNVIIKPANSPKIGCLCAYQWSNTGPGVA